MEDSIYWPAVMVAGVTGLSLSVSWQLQQAWRQANTLISLNKGQVQRLELPPGATACKACKGERKVTCAVCEGMGRTNYRNLLVLPKGVNPVLCTECRASGRVKCGRCLGTGVKPNPVGFRI